MKIIKLLFVPLVIVIAVSLLFVTNGDNKNSSEPVENQNTTTAPTLSEKVNIVVDFGNNEVVYKSFSYELTQTAFGLLQSLADMGILKVDTRQYDFGVFVKSINEYESTAEMSWIYFVNGESGQVAADQYELKPGDLVEWKYMAPSGNDQ